MKTKTTSILAGDGGILRRYLDEGIIVQLLSTQCSLGHPDQGWPRCSVAFSHGNIVCGVALDDRCRRSSSFQNKCSTTDCLEKKGAPPGHLQCDNPDLEARPQLGKPSCQSCANCWNTVTARLDVSDHKHPTIISAI
jgi:hypothetical protein